MGETEAMAKVERPFGERAEKTKLPRASVPRNRVVRNWVDPSSARRMMII
jgi:hypothetical protein